MQAFCCVLTVLTLANPLNCKGGVVPVRRVCAPED